MSGYEDLIASKSTEAPVVEAPPVVDVAPEPAPVVSEAAPSEVQAPPVETPVAAAPPAQAEPQDPMAPVKALLDERDRRQAAERRAQETERELQTIRARDAEQRRKAQEATEQMPHPLDDPERFASWLLHKQQDAVNKAVGSLDQRYANDRQEISRVMVEQHLGPEKFAELNEAIQHAPQWLHDKALKQPHPWGYMLQEFNRVKEHKRAQEALSKLGGKSLDERIAEAKAQAIAEARAQWEAEHGGGQPQVAQPAADTRARNPDGTFAPSTNQTQRHQPPSLSVVAAAPAPRGEEARGGYDALFKRG